MVWAHGFGGFAPYSLGPVAVGPMASRILWQNTRVSKAAHLEVRKLGRGRRQDWGFH